jgi:NUDIX domain
MPVQTIAQDIDYENFKNEVAKKQGKHRAKIYGKVWDVLYGLQTEPEKQPSPKSTTAGVVPSEKPRAYGGVVIDGGGQVLLRRPKGDFDGYVWTFPKGRPDVKETPEQAALREVKEETGYSAKVLRKVPGSFRGGTGVTEYFLMSLVGSPSDDLTVHERPVAKLIIAPNIATTTRSSDLAGFLVVTESLRRFLRGDGGRLIRGLPCRGALDTCRQSEGAGIPRPLALCKAA